MHAHCRLFHDLFVQLQDQAAATPSSSHASPAHRHDRPGNRMNMSTYTDIQDDMEAAEHYDSFLDADDEFVDATVQLKTTTLVQPRGSVPAATTASSTSLNESSINISVDITGSPMPPRHHLSRPPVHVHTPAAASSSQQEASSHPTPASPSNSSTASYVHLPLLPTPEMPSLSHRVQLLQAPPPSTSHAGGLDESDSFLGVPSDIATPDMHVLSRPCLSPEASSPGFPTSPSPSHPAPPFASSSSPLNTSAIATSSPHAHHAVQTPPWHATPGAPSSDFRRRFSAASEYRTPLKSKPPFAADDDDDDDMDHDMAYPNIDSPVLASPLLSTKLKVLTPHTPLSNRIAGASTQTPYRSPYASTMLSSPSTPKIPIFDLALFPVAFQKGEGAYQMTRLYSYFRNNPTQAMTLAGLVDKLDDCESERLEILLDTLVSRRLLRPFVVEGEMYWQSSFK
ncbi:hypothetical protein DYB25_013509 [Aphanomyces astaci]|uniref:Uncharacterized protein n=1 Tax=Aphanomyces astaci TaxID=112090 RepID=A0A397BRC7_APHAT|nr:hypothetical protein DYB25_013509 [Aphanomyces astaci]